MNKYFACTILCAATLGARAQTVTNAPAQPDKTARPVSLKDCIQLALQHNFDVQIPRYNPASHH